MLAEMVLLCRNNAMINARDKTQNRVRSKVNVSDPVTRFRVLTCTFIMALFVQSNTISVHFYLFIYLHHFEKLFTNE